MADSTTWDDEQVITSGTTNEFKDEGLLANKAEQPGQADYCQDVALKGVSPVDALIRI